MARRALSRDNIAISAAPTRPGLGTALIHATRHDCALLAARQKPSPRPRRNLSVADSAWAWYRAGTRTSSCSSSVTGSHRRAQTRLSACRGPSRTGSREPRNLSGADSTSGWNGDEAETLRGGSSAMGEGSAGAAGHDCGLVVARRALSRENIAISAAQTPPQPGTAHDISVVGSPWSGNALMQS